MPFRKYVMSVYECVNEMQSPQKAWMPPEAITENGRTKIASLDMFVPEGNAKPVQMVSKHTNSDSQCSRNACNRLSSDVNRNECVSIVTKTNLKVKFKQKV